MMYSSLTETLLRSVVSGNAEMLCSGLLMFAISEPYWYQGFPSPYYTENHVKFRNVMRDFVEKEIKPNMDQWLKEGKGTDCR